MGDSQFHKHIPDLGRLSISILEHFTEQIIGKSAQEIIKAPLEERRLQDELATALENTEHRFISEYKDEEVARAILDLPLADLPSVRTALRKFYQRPTDSTLRSVLIKQVTSDLPSLTEMRVENAMGFYLEILKEEMIFVSNEISEKLKTIAVLEIARAVARKNDNQSRILLVYNGNVKDERDLVQQFIQGLEPAHEVYIHDHAYPIERSQSWSYRDEIRQSHYLIVLLSKRTAFSEMMLYELEIACKDLGKHSSRPSVIPVAVRYWEPPKLPLRDYIGDSPWIIWHSPADTAWALVEIKKAVSGKQYGIPLDTLLSSYHRPVQKVDTGKQSLDTAMIPHLQMQIERPGGTMSLESAFYIRRESDAILSRELQNLGNTITIRAPRQMGKSSLLVQGIDQAKKCGKWVVYLDFQLFEKSIIQDADSFYQNFCRMISKELNLSADIDQLWQFGGTNTYLCTSFFEEHVFPAIVQPLLLAFDEVDCLLNTPFATDFFGMLRGWHNRRWKKGGWENLDLVLVISTEPFLLIPHGSQSPFNVSRIISLSEFTLRQIAELNQRYMTYPPYRVPFNDFELEQILHLFGGHPYLTHQSMYTVISQEYDAPTLISKAACEDGPFSDHLNRHMRLLMDDIRLRDAFKQIVTHHTCPDAALAFRLEAAGLVKRDGKNIAPRNGLYEKYFGERL